MRPKPRGIDHTLITFGDSRVGFSARAEIDRRDFGVTFNMPLDGGGVVVGDKIKVELEVEAILQTA